MSRFDFPPPGPKPFTLVFPHIPKTGGTTLLYHFRRNLGDNAILSYGQHNRVTRFFTNRPQLEEMSREDIDGLHVVQGHGVSSEVLPWLGDTAIKLLVVLRHPVGLTRSRFNHRKTNLAKRALEVSSDDFVRQDGENFFSSLLINKFAALADAGAQSPQDKVISILRKFDYVFTTEQLDAQVQGLMDELNLPHEMERRRVAEQKATLELSDDEIAARHPLDLAMFEKANRVVSGEGTHNPFGFDAEGRARAMAALSAAQDGDAVRLAYVDLAKAICHNLRAEAALAKLERPAPVALNDRALFQEILQEHWARMERGLSEERRKISADWREAWLKNNS
ncbi:hypothetical protein [Marimonas lutisalis]|uniref:hypothetical protein n=1 Tax=Marimonas lutisalis TaxID=2545756 RepID=UPI0010F97B5A|nr:hypothetical protein [Marimonas lutisalis]